MFDLIREVGQIFDATLTWFLAQSAVVRPLIAICVMAMLWVVWLVLRVVVVAMRAAFRGL